MQISQLENDYMEAHMKIEVYVHSNETLKVRNEEIEIELRDVTKEYTMIKKTYVVLVKSYEDEVNVNSILLVYIDQEPWTSAIAYTYILAHVMWEGAGREGVYVGCSIPIFMSS